MVDALMRIIGVSIEKPPDKASKKDVQRFLAEIEQRNYSEWTKHGYKVALKKVLQMARRW